jgi:putative endonuclease
MDNHITGRSGESLARQFLVELGFEILAQNYQFYRTGVQGRQGEIDIIALKNNILHLFEIKTRSNQKFGSPFNQITKSQIQHIKFAYQYYLSKNPKYIKLNAQFNAVSVIGKKVDVIYNAVVF